MEIGFMHTGTLHSGRKVRTLMLFVLNFTLFFKTFAGEKWKMYISCSFILNELPPWTLITDTKQSLYNEWVGDCCECVLINLVPGTLALRCLEEITCLSMQTEFPL
jgi:hypothetical protein